MTDLPPARPLRRRWWIVAAAVALLAAAAWLAVRLLLAPGARQRPSRELNVILVTIDTLRADHVGAYGAGLARTPALDALAAEGARFDRCIAQVPLTLPSHTSLLSSTYPLFNQVRDNGGFKAPEALTLISEVLKGQGLATAAFIGAFVLHNKWGLAQGWDLYSDRFDPARYGRILLENEKRADEVLADARQWLEGIGGRRFFAWIHLYDPHSPYDPPPPYGRDTPRAAYRGEVEYTDAELGKFIAFLKERGLYERTLIVVASDHGEGLGDHDEDGHGMFLYETTVHVPLIVRAPKPFAVSAVNTTVELVDVAPTILDLLALPAPREWQGRSLWPRLDGRGSEGPGEAYSETFYPRFHFGWSPLQSFRRGGLKYILAPRDELYDLERDPGELRDLASPGRGGSVADPRRRELRGRLLDFASRRSRNALRSANSGRLSAEDQRRLAALGYLSGEVRVDESKPLADPKDKIGVSNAISRASELMEGQRFEDAGALLEGLARQEPELADAWSMLGNVNLKRQRRQEALDAFRRALSLKPDNNFLMINVVKTLVGSGEVEAAAVECEAFLKVFPDDPALLEQLGHIRMLQRRPDDALPLLKRAIGIDPSSAQAYNQAGEALILKGDYAAAEEMLRRGLKENPRARNSHFLLAQVQEALGRPEAAIDLYRGELEVNDKNFQAATNLGNLLKQAGRLDEAARRYRQAIAANADLKLPRFHLAEILLRQGGDLSEAVDLCLKGIAVPPQDRDTLFGYFVLTNLYNALGEAERRDFYTRAGEKLIAQLEKK